MLCIFFFILSDILPTHCPFPICHGIWHCMGMVILSTDFHRFMECVGFSALWYYPIVVFIPLWGLIRLLSVFPTTDIILPLWGKTKWVMCEFFHQYHVPLCHGIVGTRKPSPRTFIGQWVGGTYPTLCIVGYGGVCLFVGIVFYLFAYIIIIQDGGGKSNEKNMF